MHRDERIEALLTKGVEQVLPNPEILRKRLESGEKLTIYAGYDPNAESLHIGHTITLRKLRQFQDLGHRVIFLIGDFTARIGDPDKLSVRKPLTEQEVRRNLRLYKKQAGTFIRFNGTNKALVKFNKTWLGKLRFADIISLASLVTVEQMLKRDMFVQRMKEGRPVYIHEFLYPLMQGYDSVAMCVDGEVGGNDQLFNMMTGRTLLKQLKNKEKFVITMKLLEDGTGKKMGKSEGNAVSLTDTPEEMYKKIMMWPDSLIPLGFELCTTYSLTAVAGVRTQLQTDNPRDIKMLLAKTIISEIAGEAIATKAQEAFIRTFQKGESSSLVIKLSAQANIRDALIKAGLVSSNSEFRRLVNAGSVASTTTSQKLTLEDFEHALQKDVYRIGKDRFFEIV